MTIIVDSPFFGRGFSGGDNAGFFPPFRVHDEKDFSNHANGIIAVFLVAMREIIPFDAVGIVEHPNRVPKIDAMLFQVQRGFFRVSLELHGQFSLVLYGTIITDMPSICKVICQDDPVRPE